MAGLPSDPQAGGGPLMATKEIAPSTTIQVENDTRLRGGRWWATVGWKHALAARTRRGREDRRRQPCPDLLGDDHAARDPDPGCDGPAVLRRHLRRVHPCPDRAERARVVHPRRGVVPVSLYTS